MQPTRMTGLENRLERTPRHPYLVLLPVGFAVPSLLPGPRCALTAPFHPYPCRGVGGLLSVALSLGSPPAAVSRHRISMEPGLSSPTETGAATRSTGEAHMGDAARSSQAHSRVARRQAARFSSGDRGLSNIGLSQGSVTSASKDICFPENYTPLAWNIIHEL